VVIESDGKGELHESVVPYGDLDSLTPDDIIDIVREKGIVGMGGAGFPASVKFKSAKPIDTVLLNGCECEPFLTADHRVMLEYADDVLNGMKILLKVTGAEKGIVVIEDNKHDAIELMRAKTADMEGVEVVVAKTKYPQGAEKMLIKRVLGRQVPSGGLPLDVGVIVSNVSTIKAVADAVLKGMPLIERVVSVTGPKIRKPGNFVVKIGTSVQEIVDYCGGFTDSDVTVKLGGPMMGFAITDLNVPVIKGTNGVIAIEPTVSEPAACIRCGRCVDVCPMELFPLYYVKYAETSDGQGFRDKSVRDCMECGCCEFICSAKLPIRDTIKLGKKVLAEMEAKK
jgi:electron transport complex protein RnfC